MSRSLHHLMILSDGETEHNEVYSSPRALGVGLIEWSRTERNLDTDVREEITDALREHDEEALQADYPEGTSAQLPEAEHYAETIADVLRDNDFDVYIQILDVPETLTTPETPRYHHESR